MRFQSLTPNIGVESVEETVKFYTDVLGFVEIVNVPADGKLVWAMVAVGDVSLMFQHKASLADEYKELNGRSLNGLQTFYVKVRNKMELYRKVREVGCLVKDLNTTPYGVEEFAIRDNNGNILTIAEDEQQAQPLKYDNFFVPVDDYEASKSFYSNILGLTVKFEFADRGMIAFNIGAEEPAIILKDRAKFPEAKPSVWIEVPSVQQYYTEWKAKGVKFTTEPFRIKTGWATEFYDPSGNILGITDYVS